MKKILTYLFALILIVMGVTALFFDGITKAAIEVFAKQTLKTPVSITEFSSDLSAGKINMDFIEVKNPKIFKNENAFVLNHLSAVINPKSNEKLIVLDRLEFDGLLFTLEQNYNQVNLVVLLKNLESDEFTQQVVKNKSSNGATSSESRAIINELKFVNTQLKIDTKWFKETVEVPDVVISNFGAPHGIPVNQIGGELMKLALRIIQDEVENKGLELSEKEIKEGVRRKLEGELDNLKGKLNDKAKGFLKKLGL